MSVRDYHDIDIPVLVFVGIIAVVIVLELVVGVQAYFYNVQNEEVARKQIAPTNWQLQEMILEQKAQLQDYRWVNQETDTVTIPIDRAIALIVTNEGQLPTTESATESN